ncbi:hypothetical protein [Puniceibacterium sediminis]|uniref:Uncharacterized protein n=1 Tax=Puniceibacterium sediminis TaxID=1608407 RepID=A0A238WJS5_9RHOB|nr:hypothetical protein [Puniceibacterium sediminis]SNR46822.1 hypothetical protein SAMN06265370_10679 [Puniceibacterium sediminis]
MSNIVPGRDSLPVLVDHYLPAARRERLSPLLYAGGMLALGAALLIAKPRIGHVPRATLAEGPPTRSHSRRAVQGSRDIIAPFAPSNVTDSIGRSLMIGGVALALTRVLDEMAHRRG